jgi:hypothetical protein
MGKLIDFKRIRVDCNTLAVKMLFLDDVQFAAVEGMIPMTQAIFDSIMRQREKEGEVLEEISEKVFLKYPEFGKKYAHQIEEEIKRSDTLSPLKEQLISERIRRHLRQELQVNI